MNRYLLEIHQVLQFPDALVNTLSGGLRGAGQTKSFTAEGCGHTAVDDGLSQIGFNVPMVTGKVSHHATHEGIPGAGRIDDLVEREGWGDEESVRS